MTEQGRKCLAALVELADQFPDETDGFTAAELALKFPELNHRVKPVMTVSSWLTHLKREKLVSRKVSTDKSTAWWKPTKRGRQSAQ